MDDTVDTSLQGLEEVVITKLELGMFPGFWSGSLSDLDTVEDDMMLVYRVPRTTAEMGVGGGVEVGDVLVGSTAPEHKGRFILSFDGWANDERALFQVPCIRRFVSGLLFGRDLKHPDMARAQNVLTMLLDEREIEECIPRGSEYEGMGYAMAGQHWVVAHAFASRCFLISSDGFYRDVKWNQLLLYLLRNGTMPPTGLC